MRDDRLHGFLSPLYPQNASEAQSVRFGKIIGVVIVVAAVGSATLMIQSQRPIFLSLLSVYGYFAPGITTIFLLGILWKRTTRAPARRPAS